eukprot:scaffold2276_cov160-Amphora_coffeaeformis.AAC.3
MNDVEVLRSGYLFVFPNPKEPVLLLDSTRLRHALASVLDRCVFYLLTLCSNEAAQNHGGTLVNVVSSRKGPTKNMKQKQRQWAFVHSAMPFRFKKAVVVQSHEEGEQLLLEFLAYQQSRLLGFSSGLHTDSISKDSFTNTFRGLVTKGFDRSEIPISLGGDFDHCTMLPEWTRMRISLEDAMSSAPPVRNAIPNQIIASFTRIRNKQGDRHEKNTVVVCNNKREIREEDRDEYVRQRNASYARRSYHRKKLKKVVVSKASLPKP